MLPSNIQPGTPDPIPDGVFLIPLCTTREALEQMIYALDSAYAQSRNLLVIKDFLNALQYIGNPQDAICMTTEPPPDPVVTIETDGDCQRVLVDGIPVTDWICPPDPEEPEPPEPTVGTLGFTVTELEDIVMGCLNLEGSIKMENGLIKIRTCDGWITLPGMVSPLATSQTAQSLASGLTYSQWLAAGKPELPDLPAVPYENPDYNTADSIKCAKATTIANTLRHYLQGMRDWLDDINSNTLDFEGVVAAVSAGYVIGSIPGAFAMASLVWGMKNTAPTQIAAIDANLTDSATWSEIICQTTSMMNDGTVLGSDDIDHVITNWQERDDVSELVKQAIYAIPISSWQAYGQQKVSTTECGCETYLPFGYVPPVSSGVVSYYKAMVETSNGANTQTKDISTTGYAAYNQSPPHGTKVAANKFRSTFIGSASGQYYQAIGLLIEFQDNFDLSQIKWEHSSHGANYTDYNAELYVWKPLANTWQEINTGTPSGEASTVVQNVGTIEDVKQAVIWMKASFGSTAGYFEIDNVRFTGLHNGIGFIDLPLGQPLP